MVKMMLERSSLYSSVCGTSSFAPCIVPTLRRGNAVVDAPASRNAGALQTEFPHRSVGTIKLFKGEKSIGGFTILGTGEVALIVDVLGLMQQVAGREVAVLG